MKPYSGLESEDDARDLDEDLADWTRGKVKLANIFASVVNSFPRPYRVGQKEYLIDLTREFATANGYEVHELLRLYNLITK